MTTLSAQRPAAQQSIAPLIWLQLFAYSGAALSNPYINLFLSDRGISASHIGILLSMSAIIEMLVPTFLNNAADQRGQHRRLYIAFILLMVIGNVLLAVGNVFIALAIATLILEGFFRPMLTLGMQLVITRMRQEGRNLAGRIRSFSSLGYGITSLFASWMFAVGGYVSLFLMAGASFAASLTMTGALPTTTTEETPNTPKKRARIFAPRTRGFYVVAVAMFFIMMSNRAGYAFWFVHFQQHLGVSTAQISQFAALMAFVEVPFFILLDPILRRVDVRQAFIAGSFGTVLVWIGVSFVNDPLWIYPLLMLRGVVFSVFYMSMFLLIVRVSLPSNVATNQSLIQGALPSLAVLLTGSIAGWMYDYLPPHALFLTCAALTMVGIGVIVAKYDWLVPVEAPTPTEA